MFNLLSSFCIWTKHLTYISQLTSNNLTSCCKSHSELCPLKTATAETSWELLYRFYYCFPHYTLPNLYIYIRFGTEDYTWRLDIVQTLRELWQFFLSEFFGSKFADTTKPKILLGCILQVLNNWFKQLLLGRTDLLNNLSSTIIIFCLGNYAVSSDVKRIFH